MIVGIFDLLSSSVVPCLSILVLRSR